MVCWACGPARSDCLRKPCQWPCYGPLSGSGAYGILASVINDPAIGPDSYVGYLVSTLQGSTETTFYVLAVYFGAVQVRRVRHTLAAALSADIAGVMFAVGACYFMFG